MLKSSGGLGRLALLLFCAAEFGGTGVGASERNRHLPRAHRTAARTPFLKRRCEDVSKADAPAEVIGQARIERPGNPPIRFEITYDPARIIPSHRYSVRARILVDGKLFFITDQHYPVLTGGHGNEVALLLRRAGSSGPAGGGDGPLGTLPATFAGDLPCADCPAFAISSSCFRTRLSSCG